MFYIPTQLSYKEDGIKYQGICQLYGVPSQDNSYHELIRSSPKRSGPSPAIGRVCDSQVEAKYSDLVFKTNFVKRIGEATSWKPFTYLYIQHDTWCIALMGSNNYSRNYVSVQCAWFADPEAEYTIEEVFDKQYKQRTFRISPQPYYWWQSTYGEQQYFLYWDESVLEWDRGQWYAFISPPERHRSQNFYFTPNIKVGDEWWSSVLVANKHLLPSNPNPSPYLYGENVGHSGVSFAPSSDVGGMTIEQLITAAKQDALSNVPADSLNYIETVLELFSLLTGSLLDVAADKASNKAAKSNVSKLRDGLASTWLSYRYVYNTTKMDLSDLKSLSKRITRMLMKQSTTIKSYGTATSPGGVTAKVTLEFSAAQIMDLNNPLQQLDRMFAYDVWDLVPFSFIVDWAFSFGDYLYERSLNDICIKCPPVSAWGSLSYTSALPGYDSTSVYSRFTLSNDIVQRAPDYYEYVSSRRNPSLTTILKRGLDSLALGVGLL